MTQDDLMLELNWRTDPFLDDFVLPTSDEPQSREVYVPGKILKQDLMELFETSGLIPERLTIFHQSPLFKNEVIHTDGVPFTPRYAVNWMIGDSKFAWFTVETQASNRVDLDTRGFITTFDERDVVEAYSTRSNGPFLCNIGVPHKGSNLGTRDRWSCSLRFYNRFDTWSDIHRYFSRWGRHALQTT